MKHGNHNKKRGPTFALSVEQDMLFKRGVSGVSKGFCRELREPLQQVGPLLC